MNGDLNDILPEPIGEESRPGGVAPERVIETRPHFQVR